MFGVVLPKITTMEDTTSFHFSVVSVDNIVTIA